MANASGFDLVLLDVCLPDYFRGNPHPTYAVPCWHGMTLGDLRDGLVQEMRTVLWEDERYEWDEAWVEDMFTEGADTDWSKPFDGARYIDPPELDEDGEPIDYDGPEVYAYFGFVEADRIW